MGLLNTELQSQNLVTKKLSEGYELIEARPVNAQGMTYLIAKEEGESIHILVVTGGKETYEKDWKKGQLISLKIITDAIEKQKNGNINN